MRARGLRLPLLALLALLASLLPPLAAGESALLRDAEGDVALAGADVRLVGVSRSGGDARVTVSYAAPMPLDLELVVVLQVGPAPADVVTLQTWRAASDRWPPASVAHPAPGGGNARVEGRAAFAEDAVQIVVPKIALAGWPCLELRSLRSTHHADDGTTVTDMLEPAHACDAPASGEGPGSAVEESTQARRALPHEARVPAPSVALLLVAAVAAGLLFTRRR